MSTKCDHLSAGHDLNILLHIVESGRTASFRLEMVEQARQGWELYITPHPKTFIYLLLMSGRFEMLVQSCEILVRPMAKVAFERRPVPGGLGCDEVGVLVVVPFELLHGDDMVGIFGPHIADQRLSVDIRSLLAGAVLEAVSETTRGSVGFLAEWADDASPAVDLAVQVLGLVRLRPWESMKGVFLPFSGYCGYRKPSCNRGTIGLDSGCARTCGHSQLRPKRTCRDTLDSHISAPIGRGLAYAVELR